MITIRPLQREDLHNGFLETLSNLQPTNMSPTCAEVIFDDLPDYVKIYVAVEDDGNVVGAATLLIEPKFLHGGCKAGHIEDVATHKDHQGKGIGSLLQKTLIEVAKGYGCYKILLDCEDNLIPFYEKFGYKKNVNHMRLNLK